MRLSAIDFVGFRRGDERIELGSQPPKAVVFEGPNGSGKSQLCELLFACWQLAAGGTGPVRYARPPLDRAKATLEVVLSEPEMERMGAERCASFECFFGKKAMLDASLDPDPATLVLSPWRAGQRVIARIGHDVRGMLLPGEELLLDIASGSGDAEAAPRRAALAEALAEQGLAIGGLMREGSRLSPAFDVGGERVSLGELSTGQRVIVDLLSAVAAAEHRLLVLDCVDAHLDDETSRSVLARATRLFDGWQLFIATRKRDLGLPDSVRVDLAKRKGPKHG